MRPSMKNAANLSAETPTPEETLKLAQEAEAALTARLEALEAEMKPKRPDVPPIGSMF
jgi:hypothetical protein